MKSEEWFVCECGSLEHFMQISYEPDLDEYVYLTIHLSELPLLQRIKLGIQYILGRKSRYGNFEEIVLSKKKLKQVITALNNHYLHMVKPEQNINF